MPRLTRRTFLAGTTASAATLLTGCAATSERTRSAGSRGARGDGFTFVHITDQHVARRRDGHLGYQTCMNEVAALDPQPDFALMGGDLAFDGLYNPKDEFIDQIKLYKAASDTLPFPYYNCMGNHDVLGWNARRKVDANDPDLGKKLIMDILEWEKPYYSFDHKGWHFAVLDCIHPVEADHGPDYEPRIGEEQLNWLAYDLGAAGERPKVVMTHIATFCNTGQQTGNPEARAMNHMVVQDNVALRHILERHSVKALLQGHSHRAEVYQYNNVWYITTPAASGAWWSGDWNGAAPGYTILNARDNKLDWELCYYDWTPRLEDRDTIERQRTLERELFLKQQAELLARERSGIRS
ncbi:metallophosphoesterase family protein [Mucisphaera calidilacus]|uniref:Cyclic 3',5'-adenosine monophosphate phosphodiesterase n=1 Tax=Mucisphaera calidilacus TaxID=2527982 RepID=A0A518BVG6_9BACT|nr:metallophosphoesterase [Mucisphaera calidilacus]QDU70966.1 cyclic 3',5'-adenosine monophosphate phosphodiesterase [Mucisphaera calidilacus]